MGNDLPFVKEIVVGLVVGFIMLLFKNSSKTYDSLIDIRFMQIKEKLLQIEASIEQLGSLSTRVAILEERVKRGLKP